MTAYGLFFCFFFKQKTAYDMRISDWSSDVCSSDLRKGIHADREKIDEAAAVDGGSVRRGQCHIVGARVARLAGRAAGGGGGSGGCGRVQHDLGELRGNAALDDQAGRASQRVAAGGILACVGVAALADRENAGRADRTSGGSGTSVSVRVDLVGRRYIQ